MPCGKKCIRVRGSGLSYNIEKVDCDCEADHNRVGLDSTGGSAGQGEGFGGRRLHDHEHGRYQMQAASKGGRA